MDPLAAPHIVFALKQMRVMTGFYFMALVLLVYDYLLTFSDEVTYVWQSRWSITKIVFLLNRYIAFFDATVALYHQVGIDLSPETCSHLYTTTGWMTLYGILIFEIMLILRTWAIWGMNKWVAYGLGTLLAIASILMSYYVHEYIDSIRISPPIDPGFRGCFITKVNNVVYIPFVILMAFETVIMTLTLIKGVETFRHSSSPLTLSLYRDGTLAYILLFLSTVTTVLVMLVGPPEITDLMTGYLVPCTIVDPT